MSKSKLTQTVALINLGIANGQQIGALLYISQNNHVVADLAFGSAGNGNPMAPDALSLWMSAGKPLTAAAILQLQEAGKLSVDDPVVRFIPGFAEHGKESITLRHLLTHTAPLRQGDLVPPQPWDDTIKALCRVRMEPGWVPGKKAAYHVGGTWYLLGEVVRRASGLPLGDYLREKIFHPLGMSHSFLGLDAEALKQNLDKLVLIYQTEKPPPSPHRIWSRPEILAQPRPGSNCLGPAAELGRFYEALLDGGRGILKPETVELMTRRHREGMMDHTFRHVLDTGLGVILNSNRYGAETVPYGYGRFASEETFGHCGNQCSAAFADPQHKLVVVLIYNGMPGEAAHQTRAREALSAIYLDLGLATLT
ncbi:MAG: serine hydrolase [Methylacidiphilales bacterium]|nr:serine hydrolase [Candidatus Methylacidiphilales bacterium]